MILLTQRSPWQLCQSNFGQQYINSLLTIKESGCSQLYQEVAEDTVNGCTMNSDGEFCGDVINRNYVSVLNSNCDQEIENATACRSACRDKLIEIKNALGCCVNNLYNRSRNFMPVPESLAYRVWESCGVDTPGFCEGKLVVGVITSAPRLQDATTVHNHATSIFLYTMKQSLITSLVMILICKLGQYIQAKLIHCEPCIAQQY